MFNYFIIHLHLLRIVIRSDPMKGPLVSILQCSSSPAFSFLQMSRSSRDSLIGSARNTPHPLFPNGSIHKIKDPSDDNLDLFSKTRPSFSVNSPENTDVSVKLGRLSIGSVKPKKSGLDDLLSSGDGGKHDYDWLLTPPGTPLLTSADRNESKPLLLAPRSGPLVRSISTTNASRLSVSHSENSHMTKPTRSSSVTRLSVSASQHNSSLNKSTSILNTSSVSASSYNRPSTPTNRSSIISRPSTPSARPSVSRSTTPSKSRPALSSSSVDKPRSTQNSRPSTPTRTQISGNMNSSATWTASKPSTPRRNPTQSSSPSYAPLTPSGHGPSNGRNVASLSRPSSPGPLVRPPAQAIVLPDFPLEAPPNLRTTLTERSISASRSRPGTANSAKGKAEPIANTATLPRRQSSPLLSRGRLVEPTSISRAPANGKLSSALDSRRELSTRKSMKTSTDGSALSHAIPNKISDIATKHTDMKNGNTLFRARSSSNIYPQSIPSTNHKSQPGVASVNGHIPNCGWNHANLFSENGSEDEMYQSTAKLSNTDIYESSRYDMILQKEDLKNMNWLHSIDDKSDEGSIFDNGFEHLPEPFDRL